MTAKTLPASDTPLTDPMVVVCDGASGWRHMVDADFARQLERKLRKAERRADSMEADTIERCAKVCELCGGTDGGHKVFCPRNNYPDSRPAPEAVSQDAKSVMGTGDTQSAAAGPAGTAPAGGDLVRELRNGLRFLDGVLIGQGFQPNSSSRHRIAILLSMLNEAALTHQQKGN